MTNYSANRSKSRKATSPSNFSIENLTQGFSCFLKYKGFNLISDKITYLMFSDILKELEIIHRRFIKEERKFVYDFWALLKGNVKKFVFGYELLGAIIWVLGFKEKDVNDLKLNQSGMNVKEFNIFKDFVKNSANFKGKNNFNELKRKIQDSRDVLNTMQTLSTSSSYYNERERYVNSFRRKIISQSPTPEKIKSVQDYLLLKKEIEVKKLQYKRQKKEEDEMKECTFKPQIQNYNSNPLPSKGNSPEKSKNFTSVPLGDLRNVFLYELSKEKSRKQSVSELQGLEQREKEEIRECTFKPKINSRNQTPSKIRCITSMSQINASDQENLVYYIPRNTPKGQKYLEENKIKLNQKNISQGKIFHQNSKSDLKKKSRSQPQKQKRKPKSPSNQILIVNLKISNGKYEKVRLRRNEDPSLIIKQFALKHSFTFLFRY